LMFLESGVGRIIDAGWGEDQDGAARMDSWVA